MTSKPNIVNPTLLASSQQNNIRNINNFLPIKDNLSALKTQGLPNAKQMTTSIGGSSLGDRIETVNVTNTRSALNMNINLPSSFGSLLSSVNKSVGGALNSILSVANTQPQQQQMNVNQQTHVNHQMHINQQSNINHQMHVNQQTHVSQTNIMKPSNQQQPHLNNNIVNSFGVTHPQSTVANNSSLSRANHVNSVKASLNVSSQMLYSNQNSDNDYNNQRTPSPSPSLQSPSSPVLMTMDSIEQARLSRSASGSVNSDRDSLINQNESRQCYSPVSQQSGEC